MPALCCLLAHARLHPAAATKLALQPHLRAIASLKDWPDGVHGFKLAAKQRFEMSLAALARLAPVQLA